MIVRMMKKGSVMIIQHSDEESFINSDSTGMCKTKGT